MSAPCYIVRLPLLELPLPSLRVPSPPGLPHLPAIPALNLLIPGYTPAPLRLPGLSLPSLLPRLPALPKIPQIPIALPWDIFRGFTFPTPKMPLLGLPLSSLKLPKLPKIPSLPSIPLCVGAGEVIAIGALGVAA